MVYEPKSLRAQTLRPESVPRICPKPVIKFCDQDMDDDLWLNAKTGSHAHSTQPRDLVQDEKTTLETITGIQNKE